VKAEFLKRRDWIPVSPGCLKYQKKDGRRDFLFKPPFGKWSAIPLEPKLFSRTLPSGLSSNRALSRAPPEVRRFFGLCEPVRPLIPQFSFVNAANFVQFCFCIRYIPLLSLGRSFCMLGLLKSLLWVFWRISHWQVITACARSRFLTSKSRKFLKAPQSWFG